MERGSVERQRGAVQGAQSAAGRHAVCDRPVILGSAQTSMSKKVREWGIPGETFPVAAPAHSTGTKSWCVWSRQGNRSPRCPARRKTPKSSVPESVFDPKLAIFLCANVTRLKGGVCRVSDEGGFGRARQFCRAQPASRAAEKPTEVGGAASDGNSD